MGSFTSSILPNYTIVETFKKGLESDLFVVKSKDNETRLLKTISTTSLTSSTIKSFITRTTQINKLNNINIMKYHEISESNGLICTVMKKYDYSLINLDNPAEYFKNNKYSVINSVCNGIMAIHNEGLYHGNIKPSNILFNLSNDLFVVSDYLRNDLNINSSSGIPMNLDNISYISPEALSNKEIGKESDIWCIGCIYYYIIIGHNIFEGKTIIEIGNKILNCNYDKPDNFEDLKAILKNTINKNVNDRIDIEKLILLLDDIKLKELPTSPICDDTRVDLPTFIYSKISSDKKDQIDKTIIDYKSKEKTELNFSDMDIGDSGVEYICYQLNTLRHIKELNLNLCKINDSGLECLSNHFKYIPELESLWIGSNNITDDGLKHLSKNCKYIQKLKKLGLANNKISDIGGYILAECLKECRELNVLWINENVVIKKEKIEERIKENHSNKTLFISI